MSSQGSAVHTPNNNSDQSFPAKVDLALYGSPVQIRANRNVARRASSFVKMATEDHQIEENHHRPARLTRSDARRGSSFIRAMSEDMNDDNRYLGGKTLSPNVRRGSSFLMPGDDSHEDPKTPKDIRRGSSFIRTSDDSLEDGAAFGRRLDVRRGSSFIRMISEDINNDEMHSTGRLSSKPDSRRGSGVSKMMSEDINEDLHSTGRLSSKSDNRRGSAVSKMMSEDINEDMHPTGRLSSKADSRRSSGVSKMMSEDNNEDLSSRRSSSAMRRGSSLSRMISEENDADVSQTSDFAIRTSNENNDDSTDRLFVNSSLSYLSWIESVNTVNSDCVSNTTAPITDENRTGEWNSFWTNYNSSRNEYFSSPYLCPSNSGEDLSLDSNGSTQRGYTDKSATDNVVLTAEEVNEAILCTQRLMDILRGAVKRSETDVILSKSDEGPNYPKEDQKSNSDEKSQKDKSLFKSTNNSCIDVILNHTGVADILKRVINKRREVIMPPDEASTPKSSLSEWSISKK